VVDDDPNICEIIKLYLSEEYVLHFAHDGSTALNLFHQTNPDLIILDLLIPVINGYEVCKLIRQESNIPIIMLTAKDDTREKIAGLDCGADDYVVKPFEPLELNARIRAQLRRTLPAGKTASPENVFIMGDLALDLNRFEVRVKDQLVHLKPREVGLLHYLLLNKNMLLTRDQLLEEVWGYDYAGDTRTVDVHIRRLRDKLGSSSYWEITTVWGMGYKLVEKRA
jgi:DNA-binding response OmpR family regulator